MQAFLEEAKATGPRRGELLGLKWTDIDWKNGIIKVRRQVARVDGQIVEAPLKAKNSYRAVTISQQAIKVLKHQKAKTHDQHVFPSATPSQPSHFRTVSGMLGHFFAGITLDTYAHVTTAAQKEAAQTMGNVLSM